MRRRPHFVYRVYFTIDPETYYVVGAANVKAAVRWGRRSWRAFAISNRSRRLTVLKVERLLRGGRVRELKIGG